MTSTSRLPICCHTEYLVFCGLGVPSLRLLWGAVRNRQWYILCAYCKSCIFFSNIRICFTNYMTCRGKKVTRIERKLHTLTIFL